VGGRKKKGLRKEEIKTRKTTIRFFKGFVERKEKNVFSTKKRTQHSFFMSQVLKRKKNSPCGFVKLVLVFVKKKKKGGEFYPPKNRKT